MRDIILSYLLYYQICKVKNCLIIILLLFGFVSAQNIVELYSLQQALGLAAKQNLVLKGLEWQRKISHTEVSQSQSGLWPTINLNANSDYNLNLPVQLIPASVFGGPVGTFREIRFGRNWNNSVAGDFTWAFLQADKYAQSRSGTLVGTQTVWDRQEQRRKIMIEVASNYLQILILQETQNLNLMLDSVASLLAENTHALYLRSVGNKVDWQRAQNLKIQQHQQSIQIETQKKIALRKLAASLNLPDSISLKVVEMLPLKNQQSPFERMDPHQLPAVKSARVGIELSKWKYRQTAWSAWPKLSLNSRYTFAEQTDYLFSKSANRFSYGTIGMSLSIPILKGRSQQLLKHKAKYQWELARIQYLQQEKQAALEIQEWQDLWNEKSQSLQFAEERDKQAENNLILSTDSYFVGLISLDQLFNIYSEYAQAHNNYLQVLTDKILYQSCLELSLQSSLLN
jgi:outer membrane protein TolC